MKDIANSKNDTVYRNEVVLSKAEEIDKYFKFWLSINTLGEQKFNYFGDVASALIIVLYETYLAINWSLFF